MSGKRSYKSKSSYAPKKSGAGKIWAGAIAFVLTGAIVASVMGVGTSGFKDWSFSKWFGSNQEEIKIEEEIGGGALITETVSQGLSLMSASIEPTAYADYGVAAAATSAYTITANAQPAEALKEIDWAIAWKNSSSTWASGKSVESYVTYAVSEDTTTATVSCSQAFGEPIVITATSAYNTDAKATCQVDYLRAVQSVVNDNTVLENNYFIIGDTTSMYPTITFGVGTITGEIKTFNNDCKTEIKMTTSFLNALRNNNRYYTYFFNQIDNGYDACVDFDNSYTLNFAGEFNAYYTSTVNNSDGTITIINIGFDDITTGLENCLTFNSYKDEILGTVTPNYSNCPYINYLKYAVTYATLQNSSHDLEVTNTFAYTYNNQVISYHNATKKVKIKADEFPIPTATNVAMNNTNLVFGY